MDLLTASLSRASRGALLLAVLCLAVAAPPCFAIRQPRDVEAVPGRDAFPFVHNGAAANLCVDSGDYAGVVRSVRDILTTHNMAEPGYHVLKFRMVDPGVVLQKLVVDLGGMKPSYLGPPESYHK